MTRRLPTSAWAHLLATPLAVVLLLFCWVPVRSLLAVVL